MIYSELFIWTTGFCKPNYCPGNSFCFGWKHWIRCWLRTSATSFFLASKTCICFYFYVWPGLPDKMLHDTSLFSCNSTKQKLLVTTCIKSRSEKHFQNVFRFWGHNHYFAAWLLNVLLHLLLLQFLLQTNSDSQLLTCSRFLVTHAQKYTVAAVQHSDARISAFIHTRTHTQVGVDCLRVLL